MNKYHVIIDLSSIYMSMTVDMNKENDKLFDIFKSKCGDTYNALNSYGIDSWVADDDCELVIDLASVEIDVTAPSKEEANKIAYEQFQTDYPKLLACGVESWVAEVDQIDADN